MEEILVELQEIKALLKELTRKVVKGEEKPIVIDEILKDWTTRANRLMNTTTQRWDIATVKLAVARFIDEHDRLPSATDFDSTVYLPSARQVQRSFGGMSKLRKELGHGDIDFTRGKERGDIAKRVNKRGIEFEESLERVLCNHFGEVYVHTQKRYGHGTKNRFDFFIYSKDYIFGVDVFSIDTENVKNIEKNIRHKIIRYKDTSPKLPIFFVLEGTHSRDDLKTARSLIDRSGYADRFKLLDAESFLDFATLLTPLDLPSHLVELKSIWFIDIDDVDAKYAELKKLGIEASSEPRDWDWGTREFVVKDLDGYKLCFRQRSN